MEFLRHALRWDVTSTRPNDVLYVQSVPSIPRTNLGQQNQRVKLAARFSLILDEARSEEHITKNTVSHFYQICLIVLFQTKQILY